MSTLALTDLGSMVQIFGADNGDGTAEVRIVLLPLDEEGTPITLATFYADKDNTDASAWLIEAHAKIAAAFTK